MNKFICNCSIVPIKVGKNKEDAYVIHPCPTHNAAPELLKALKDLLNALPVEDVIPNTDAARYIENAQRIIAQVEKGRPYKDLQALTGQAQPPPWPHLSERIGWWVTR